MSMSTAGMCMTGCRFVALALLLSSGCGSDEDEAQARDPVVPPAASDAGTTTGDASAAGGGSPRDASLPLTDSGGLPPASVSGNDSGMTDAGRSVMDAGSSPIDAASAGDSASALDSGSGDASTGFGNVAVADLSKKGTYTSMTVQSTGPNGKYTIYRPQQLAANGAKNPFIAWISGGGSSPSQYTLLPHLATHGFVIIASNTVPQVGQQQALGKEMVAAVDWMLAEISRSGSEYAGKVDGAKVAAMGYSMGALAATAAGSDPRWTTTVHISGGAGDGTVKKLHAPAAMLCGASGADIAGANCAKDFDQASTPVFYGVFNGGDHLGVRTQPYADRIAGVVTGWLRWQLMSDQMLKSMFVGDACTVCGDSNWTVKRKNLQ
jgi:dienelactone hydrolase